MKCLTYNIQAGVGTRHYFDYVLNAHKQLVSTPKKRKTIEKIANFIKGYDVIMLQEVDLGGRRNSFESQAKQIQNLSGHKYLMTQINRVVPNVSLHGNIILSKTPLHIVFDEKLPGRYENKNTGRGILIASTTIDEVDYCLANTHFSLGKFEQKIQFDFVAMLLRHEENIILTGDFNCGPKDINYKKFIYDTGLLAATTDEHLGFPSWKPKKALDHIFISPNIAKFSCQPIQTRLSDHLPIELSLA